MQKTFLTVIITALIVGGGVYYWQNRKSVAPTTEQPIIERSEEVDNEPVLPTTFSGKPVITFPPSGPIADAAALRGEAMIRGKAAPNAELLAYINYPEEDLKCLTSNSYANGGSATTDAQGNFELNLTEPCAETLTVVVAEAPEDSTTCQSADKISEPVTFALVGERPQVCNQ